MQSYLLRTLFFFILLSFATLKVFASENFTIDPNHSFVEWHINHFGFSTPSGKWFVQGSLTLDKEKPQNSKVDITIPVSEMVTGIPELDKHLKGTLFFDTAKYPKATFVSNKVVVEGSDKAKVYGDLTLHGVTKPVVLDVTLNKAGINPISNKMTVGFTAHTTLKRSDFNMNTLLPGLGDEVKLNIEAEAYQTSGSANAN